MKKIIIVALSLAATLCACNKQELSPADSGNTGLKQTIIAKVNLATDTKLAYECTQNGTQTVGGQTVPKYALTSVWEEGDTFKAIQDDGTVVTFTLAGGAGTTSGTFTATAENVTESTAWKAVLGNGTTVSSEIHCGYMDQTGKLEDLGDFTYVTASGTGLTPSFDFDAGGKLSYILRVVLPAGVKTVEYTPCAYCKVSSSGEEDIYFNSKDENDYSADKTSTISLSAASAAGDVAYISIPAVDYSRTRDTYNNGKQNCNLKCAIVITLLNDTEENATLSNGFVFEENVSEKGGKFITLDLSALELISRPKPSEAIEFKANDVQCTFHSSAGKQEGDLDTFWAPYNIGASKASEMGWYIQFGEYSTDGVYTYANYTLHHKPASNDYVDVIVGGAVKLAEGGINKTFYTVSETRYDAARVVWGTSWRMPHMIEEYVLTENSTVTDTQFDGVEGVKISNNGNDLYIRFTGVMRDEEDGKDVFRYPSEIDLWSADKIQRSATNAGWDAAYVNYYEKGGAKGMTRYVHFTGLQIRPVLTKSTVTNN